MPSTMAFSDMVHGLSPSSSQSTTGWPVEEAGGEAAGELVPSANETDLIAVSGSGSEVEVG